MPDLQEEDKAQAEPVVDNAKVGPDEDIARVEPPDPEPAFRHVFEKRARQWAEGRGLISLLSSLEALCPHTFTLAAAELSDEAPRPWVPAEGAEEREVKLAYHKATRLLHPDRLSKRDLSVRIEAEEVLKVLTTAFSTKIDWLKEADPTMHDIPSKVEPTAARSSSAKDIRDSIFGNAAKPATPTSPGGSWMPPPPPTRTNSTPSSGGTDLRDSIFAGAFEVKPKPSPPVTASSPFDDPPGGSSNPFGEAATTRVSDASLSAAAALFGAAPPSESSANPFGPPSPVPAGCARNPFE